MIRGAQFESGSAHSVWHRALETTFSRTSPFFGGATLTRVTRTSFTPNATAASHSMTSPAVASALYVINDLEFGSMVSGALWVRHDRAPEGGGQHGQPEP
jgi:hypothetical protein